MLLANNDRKPYLVTAFRNFFIEENGQATMEYVIILAASVTGAAALARQIMNTLDAGILRLGAQLEQDLKTGRAPLNVWQN
jgi:hypothetical protein